MVASLTLSFYKSILYVKITQKCCDIILELRYLFSGKIDIFTLAERSMK
jgi:hypothetical protein